MKGIDHKAYIRARARRVLAWGAGSPMLWSDAESVSRFVLRPRQQFNLNVLAAVLARANSCPPADEELKEAFYSIKDHILRTWGIRRGCIVQRITQPCWGVPGYYGQCDEYCYKCLGTGIYSERFYKLEEWEICGRIMHRPLASVRQYKGPIGMEGRKQYRQLKYVVECRVALFMLFDPRRSADSLRHCSNVNADFMRRVVRILQAIGSIPKSIQLEHISRNSEDEVPF